jgi:hypothetical protein
MRFRLRTLLILLAIGPPMLAWIGWPAWLAYRDYQHQEAMHRLMLAAPRIITCADAEGVRLPPMIEDRP